MSSQDPPAPASCVGITRTNYQDQPFSVSSGSWIQVSCLHSRCSTDWSISSAPASILDHEIGLPSLFRLCCTPGQPSGWGTFLLSCGDRGLHTWLEQIGHIRWDLEPPPTHLPHITAHTPADNTAKAMLGTFEETSPKKRLCPCYSKDTFSLSLMSDNCLFSLFCLFIDWQLYFLGI